MNFKRGIVIAIIVFFVFNSIYAQVILQGVPDSLIQGAHVIVLREDLDFTILDLDKSQIDYKVEYVVLKKSGYVPEYLSVMFDKYTKIKKAKVEIFDKENKRIKKINLSKFNKYLFTNSMTVADDAGVKYASVPDVTPPYKVVFSYKVIKKGNNGFFPVWRVVDKEYHSVKIARLKVIDKVGDNLLYKSINISPPDIKKKEDATVYEWRLNNFKYKEFEDFNHRHQDYFPTVLLAAKRFKVEDYVGEMNSWQSIGRFMNLMLEGRDDFSEEQKEDIRSQVNEDDSDYEKVKKLYSYLQNTTRYVSIQLGIGGWQPFRTSFVHEKKYGDCKALTFYMKAMLNLVGIPSYYTLVRAGAGADDVLSSFPFMRFNHAFLCVPVKEDTIWLECTSRYSEFGYTGRFTDDRNVLVINEDGGKLVRSKIYDAEENVKSVKVQLRPDSTFDNTFVAINTYMKGLAIEDKGFFWMQFKNKEKQKKWLQEIIKMDNYDIKKFNINKAEGDIIPQGSYSVELISRNLFVKAGDNLLFKPFAFSPLPLSSITEKNAEHDMVIRRSFIVKDTVVIEIPAGYKCKKLLPDYEIKNEFGEYMLHSDRQDNKIIIIRKLKLLKGEYPSSKFKEFREFINTIKRRDNKRCILKKDAGSPNGSD